MNIPLRFYSMQQLEERRLSRWFCNAYDDVSDDYLQRQTDLQKQLKRSLKTEFPGALGSADLSVTDNVWPSDNIYTEVSVQRFTNKLVHCYVLLLAKHAPEYSLTMAVCAGNLLARKNRQIGTAIITLKEIGVTNSLKKHWQKQVCESNTFELTKTKCKAR